MKQLITIIVAALLFAQCSCKIATSDDSLPKSPDYNDSTQWHISNRHSDVDVFYIISTETGDYTINDTTYHYADTHNDSVRAPMHAEMLGVDTLLSGTLNFYTPYYRQCSLQSFATKSDTLQRRMAIATDDVKRAFKHYLKHLNGNRPFILAGFSQGAMIMLELMKDMDDNTAKRMVAAYAFGITITQPDVDATTHIVAAKGADDVGVTICYNSVRDASCAMTTERSVMAINPVNWRTDATPAPLVTEPTPLLPVDRQQCDNLTVRLDVASNLLFVSGYTATDYVLPLIGKDGNYHSREIWLYRHQLRDNMALRAAKYREQH